MAGVKGRSGSGGKRPGAGRKSLANEQDVKEQLQKYLPQAYKAVERELKDPLYKLPTSVWKLLDKFVGDRKVTELEGPDGGPIEIVVVEDVNNNNNE